MLQPRVRRIALQWDGVDRVVQVDADTLRELQVAGLVVRDNQSEKWLFREDTIDGLREVRKGLESTLQRRIPVRFHPRINNVEVYVVGDSTKDIGRHRDDFRDLAYRLSDNGLDVGDITESTNRMAFFVHGATKGQVESLYGDFCKPPTAAP